MLLAINSQTIRITRARQDTLIHTLFRVFLMINSEMDIHIPTNQNISNKNPPLCHTDTFDITSRVSRGNNNLIKQNKGNGNPPK